MKVYYAIDSANNVLIVRAESKEDASKLLEELGIYFVGLTEIINTITKFSVN